MRLGIFLLMAPLAMPAVAMAQSAAPAVTAAPAAQDQSAPITDGSGAVGLVPNPAAEGLQPAAEPPPVGIRLGFSDPVTPPPGQSPAATVIHAGGTAPKAAPPTPSGLQVSAGMSFAAPNAATGRVGISADLIGSGPNDKRAQVTGADPYAVPTAPRTVDRDVGVGVSYTVPTGSGATVRISGSVGVASYAPDEPVRQPLGMTSIKVDF